MTPAQFWCGYLIIGIVIAGYMHHALNDSMKHATPERLAEMERMAPANFGKYWLLILLFMAVFWPLLMGLALAKKFSK